MSIVYSTEGYCPVCEKAAVFSARFDWYRDHLQCESCGSIPRERAAALLLNRHRPNWRELRIHESSPEPRGLSIKLRRECSRYVASNFLPTHKLGEQIDDFRNENLEAQTFADDSFDIVLALDVLEHVNRPDDALAEIARTLKPGGIAILTTPTYKDRVTSERRALYQADGSVRHFAEPEFHGNPVSAEGSLVTFHFGYDLARAIYEWSGLDVEVSRFSDHHHGVIGEFTEVYVATRNRARDAAIADRTPAVGGFAGTDAEGGTVVAAASAAGVPDDVHPDDAIFHFIVNNPSFASRQEAIGYYYQQGRDSALQARELIDRWMPQGKAPLRILEFAAGYGAVTRHASQLLAPHELVASDIHPAANAFITRQFGVPTVPSARVPEELVLPRPFNVIFALSFFSHMPRSTWLRWLRRLYEEVAPGGVLFFTTHGRKSMMHFPQARLDGEGYWFEASSEQGDLDTADYGQAITAKEFVDAQIASLPDVEYLLHEPGYWWGHQDLYVLRRRA